jgi:hypothetical protein
MFEGGTARPARRKKRSRVAIAIGMGAVSAIPLFGGVATALEACPADLVPPAGFTDVPADSVHRLAIDCMASYGVVQGTSATTYSPDQPTTRGQAAEVMYRIHVLHWQFPVPDGSDHFTDDDGSVHERAINALAETGFIKGRTETTFEPQGLLTRGQMATLMVRAWELALHRTAPAGDERFGDVADSVHHDAINAAAALGMVNGVTSSTYEPQRPVRRDEMASALARFANAILIGNAG